MRTSLRHPWILALATLAALSCLAPSVRAAAMLAPSGVRPKDFAFIKKNGVYHLFYIRHNDSVPAVATENDLGHAISTDLYHWTQLPPVMAVDPSGWDNLHIWAPHIVASGGLYWMFYTGVTSAPGQFADTQRIGVAVSTDLMTWNRIASQPVWQTSIAPWAWWNPTNANMACRDPFVMADPAAPGHFLMYYTASPASDTVATLVGVARCTLGDLTQWVDEKPLWVTHRSYSFNVITESPHLIQHESRWFLIITANAGQPLSFFVGADPLGEPAQWTYRGRLSSMLGVDTRLWFASEGLRDGVNDLFAHCAASLIQIHRIVWGTGDNFTFTEPAYFHVVDMAWTRSSAREFEPIGLRFTTANWNGFTGRLRAFVRGPAGIEVPAPLDSLGLPEVPVLTSDSTVMAWYPRRWPSTLAPNVPMLVRVAMDDSTATTPWLTLSPNPHEPVAPHGPLSRYPDDPDEDFPVPDSANVSASARPAGAAARPGVEVALRTLDGTPMGAGPAVAFELADPGHVRVDVFDLQGRRVVTLADRGFPAGAHVLPWNARDASGERVPRGLYFVRLIAPDGRAAGSRLLVER